MDVVLVVAAFIVLAATLLTNPPWNCAKRSRIEKPVEDAPLPKINQLDELVEKYIAEHSDPTHINKDSIAQIAWEKQYFELIEDIQFEKLKERMPFETTGLTKEGSVLQIIRLMESRHGFDHPKTQQAVRFHQNMLKRWDNRVSQSKEKDD